MKRIDKKFVKVAIVFFIMLCGCHSTQTNNKEANNNYSIKFSCKGIYVDTSGNYVFILFKIKASNKGERRLKYFVNTSSYHKDSMRSNFYIKDTTYYQRYQLFLPFGPYLNYLYPGHSYYLRLQMIRGVSKTELKAFSLIKKDPNSFTDSSLIINFLKRSKLIYKSRKEDFIIHHIKMKYHIKNTFQIDYQDSTPIYFSIPLTNEFPDDSLFRVQHHVVAYINKS